MLIGIKSGGESLYPPAQIGTAPSSFCEAKGALFLLRGARNAPLATAGASTSPFAAAMGSADAIKNRFPSDVFFFFFHCCCKLIRQRRHGREKKSQRALCIIRGTFSNAVAASLQHSTQIRSPAARQEMKHGHNAQAACIQSPCLHPLRTDIVSVSSKRRRN